MTEITVNLGNRSYPIVVGAGALVPAGATIPSGVLVLGSPAKVVRKLRPAELRMLTESARSYVALSGRHKTSSRVVFGSWP
mgnify:CR=1 FL=1